MLSEYQPWTLERIQYLGLMLGRYLLWLVLIHVALHFFYFSAIRYHLDIMQSLDLWTLCGVG